MKGLLFAMCGIYPAGIVTTIAGATVASSLTALGQVIKEKLQEKKLDFSLGVSEKVGDDKLASKLCKILRELSTDQKTFNNFAELIDLDRNNVAQLKTLINIGNERVKENKMAEGKTYSYEIER